MTEGERERKEARRGKRREKRRRERATKGSGSEMEGGEGRGGGSGGKGPIVSCTPRTVAPSAHATSTGLQLKWVERKEGKGFPNSNVHQTKGI